MKIKPKIILFLVIISAMLLLMSQIFNTLNLYNQNKESILKDINTTFDNSVEYYYNETAKHNFIAVVGSNNSIFKFFDNHNIDSLMQPIPANEINSVKIGKNKKNR